MATHESTATAPGMDSEKGTVTNHSRRNTKVMGVSALWRLLTFAATLSAFVVMITNRQSRTIVTPLGSGKLWAKYHYSTAFIWFVVANGLAFVYSLLTLALTPLMKSAIFSRLLRLTDLMMAFILLSAASAATAIAYVGQNGLDEAQWGSICGTFKRYCHHSVGALVASYLGWLFLTLGLITSLHQKH